MKNQFHSLQQLLTESYQKKEVNILQSLALEYLNLATQNKDNWNYGNAIHVANIHLGLIAFDNGNIAVAKKYLLKAASTPGSPQLNSFGPNMLLAKKLLERQEMEIVLKYIQLCKKFWKIRQVYPLLKSS